MTSWHIPITQILSRCLKAVWAISRSQTRPGRPISQISTFPTRKLDLRLLLSLSVKVRSIIKTCDMYHPVWLQKLVCWNTRPGFSLTNALISLLYSRLGQREMQMKPQDDEKETCPYGRRGWLLSVRVVIRKAHSPHINNVALCRSIPSQVPGHDVNILWRSVTRSCSVFRWGLYTG